jgi:phosphoribosyl 1,2-cyclic phosphodiesterase
MTQVETTHVGHKLFGTIIDKLQLGPQIEIYVLVEHKNTRLLIDTSPDLRFQLLKNKIRSIDKVFYTHLHADQTHGINDLRPIEL